MCGSEQTRTEACCNGRVREVCVAVIVCTVITMDCVLRDYPRLLVVMQDELPGCKDWANGGECERNPGEPAVLMVPQSTPS